MPESERAFPRCRLGGAPHDAVSGESQAGGTSTGRRLHVQMTVRWYPGAMTDLRKNLIGPCASVDPNSQEVHVDLAALIRRLLLFDTYILQSTRLREFPAIVAGLGYEQTMELLSSNVLKIHCDTLTIGQVGQWAAGGVRQGKGPLPLGSFSFALLKIPEDEDIENGSPASARTATIAPGIRNRQEYIHSCLQQLHTIPSLSQKQVIKLKQRVVGAFVTLPRSRGRDTGGQLNEDLRAGSPIITHVLQRSLKERHNIDVPLSELEIRISPLDETDFRVETNIERFGLDTLEAHKVVEHALLGVGGLNQRVEEMSTYNAISGCLDAECPLFMRKLGFLLERCRPGADEAQFQRLLELRGLPEFLPAIDKLDVPKLLSIRDSAEAREFRAWLASIDSAPDDEVRRRVGSLTAKIGNAVQSKPGKAARFVTTTGLGLLAPVAGGIAGAIDTFLVEKILPKSGIWTFLNKLYPSIFGSRD